MTKERWRRDTVSVRGGLTRTGFDETSEGLFLPSGYVYGSAEEAEAAFAGEVDRYIYSRYGNPTVTMFEERFRLLEGAEAAWATATGMAAVFYALAASLTSGGRVVAARGLFGSCFIILDTLLPRWGIETEFVDGTDLAQWEAALSTPADVVFFESPSNPMQELIDIEAVSALAHNAGARVIVDNVFATPVYQLPLALGADISVYSTTKHIDGHGRTLGGVICGTEEFIYEELQPLMRHTGPSMSPFNAWVLISSLESLTLRVNHQTASALKVANYIQEHGSVVDVRYPWLSSHPQVELAHKQMTGGVTVVTFEIDGGREEAFKFVNALSLIDISNNLGDAKSLVTHPATTTHRRLGPDTLSLMGISDGVIRISVGLEDVDDILEDIDRGLETL
jgi:O-succinylhomoserine sulfhydrylase